MCSRSIVNVKNLSVSYNGIKALENISFSINSKQIVGIIGPNGAGKSTLIKAVMGLVYPEKGLIKVWNQSVSKVNKKIAYIPQHNNIDYDFPLLVESVVIMGRYPYISWWGLPSKSDRKIVEECLEQVGMLKYKKRQIGQLSGGQRQRVFIARALAQRAELLLFDEPFAGIDAASEDVVIDLFKNLKSEGKTLFVVHHDLSKVEKYFDSIILLNKSLIGFGSVKDVFQVDKLNKAYEGNTARLSNNELMVVNG